MATIASKSLMWSSTPLNKKIPNSGWSEDAMIRIYDSGRTDTFEKFIRNSGISFTDYVVYILYYDDKDKMTCLKDLRSDILYTIPSGAKSKGYVLAAKLNYAYKGTD